MKYQILFFVLLFLLLFANCKDLKSKKNEENGQSIVFTDEVYNDSSSAIITSGSFYVNPLDSTRLKMRILEQGDRDALDSLEMIYEGDRVKILPYYLIISELHDTKGYENPIYSSIINGILLEDETIDPNKKDVLVKIAIYYINKNLKSNDDFLKRNAILTLAQLYRSGIGVDKNPELVKYIEDGGSDIEGFLEKQK